MDLEIPPQFQLLTALIIGSLVAIGAVYKFFSDLRAAPDQNDQQQLRLLGAALGDSQALTGITDELREIRAVMQHHIDTDKTGDLVEVMKRIADQNERRALAPHTPARRSH